MFCVYFPLNNLLFLNLCQNHNGKNWEPELSSNQHSNYSCCFEFLNAEQNWKHQFKLNKIPNFNRIHHQNVQLKPIPCRSLVMISVDTGFFIECIPCARQWTNQTIPHSKKKKKTKFRCAFSSTKTREFRRTNKWCPSLNKHFSREGFLSPSL